MYKQQAPIRYDKFDISNLNVEKPQENKMVSTQLISYPRYMNGQLNIQTPWIQIISGGIPSKDSKYYKDDKQRANNVKISFDPNDAEAMKLHDALVKIDEMLGSEEYKAKIFDKPKQYHYQPIVRESRSDEDDEDDDEESKETKNKSDEDKPKLKYIKVRLALETDDTVKTAIFQKDENNKLMRLQTVTVDDVMKYVRYMSKIRFVMQANKFYAMKEKNTSNKKMYGITFKFLQIEVEQSKTAAKFDFDTPVFDDDDNDNTVTSTLEALSNVNITLSNDTNDLDNIVSNDEGIEVNDQITDGVNDVAPDDVPEKKKGRKKN